MLCSIHTSDAFLFSSCVEGVPPSNRGQDARDTGSGRGKPWQK
ncbi:MAG: hypothetical protein ACYSTT_02070 [Planctomycetota bacterium]|jgi:hypothetical protein